MTSHTAYWGGRFWRVQLDDDGALVGDPVELTPDQAVPALVTEYLNGTLVRTVADDEAGARATTDPIGTGDFEEGVIVAGFERVWEDGGTLAERFERLHRMFGDSPDVVRLVTQRLGEDIASQIWSPDRVSRYTQNDAPPDAPPPDKADVIQGAPSQGVGPLPPTQPPGGAGGGATDPRGTSAGADSGGQGTSSSPVDDSRTGGDPVLLASGQLYLQVTDLEVAGRGLHFALTRTYLSQAVYRGPLGHCWDHSYNLWLREEQETLPDGAPRNVVYRSTGQVREDRYVQDLDQPAGPLDPLHAFVDAEFTGPPGFFDRLRKSGGRYRLEMPTGVMIEYGLDLFAERIVDRNGNEMRLAYDDGRLSEVRDPVGKGFRFAYDLLGRIITLEDVAGHRHVSFTYGDNGDLVRYDDHGRLVERWSGTAATPALRILRTTFDPDGLPRTSTPVPTLSGHNNFMLDNVRYVNLPEEQQKGVS